VPAFTALGRRRGRVVVDASTKVGRSGPYMVTWLYETAEKSANGVLIFRYRRYICREIDRERETVTHTHTYRWNL
jgi:hypothetical protein